MNVLTVIALSLLLSVANLPESVQAGEVPDPCKLLSANQIRETLVLPLPLIIDPRPINMPDLPVGWWTPLTDFSYTRYPLQKDEYACVGRSGGLWISIYIGPATPSPATAGMGGQIPERFRRMFGYKKDESTSEGGIFCDEMFTASDSLHREVGDENLIPGLVKCWAIRGDHRIAISVRSDWPRAQSPASPAKLRALTKQAATQL